MYQLRNIENDKRMAYFKESEKSPWFERLSETEDWIAQEEEKRLRGENIEAPNTKWVFEEFLKLDALRTRNSHCELVWVFCQIGCVKKMG